MHLAEHDEELDEVETRLTVNREPDAARLFKADVPFVNLYHEDAGAQSARR
jgi:hypothetical protein